MGDRYSAYKLRRKASERTTRTSDEEFFEPLRGGRFDERPTTSEVAKQFEGIGDELASRIEETVGERPTFTERELKEVKGLSRKRAQLLEREASKRGMKKSLPSDQPIQGRGRKEAKTIADMATSTFEFGDNTLTPLERSRAEAFHDDRSEEARRVDERRQAPVAASYTQWRSAPSQYDFPGVDSRQSAEAMTENGGIFEPLTDALTEKIEEADREVKEFTRKEFDVELNVDSPVGDDNGR